LKKENEQQTEKRHQGSAAQRQRRRRTEENNRDKKKKAQVLFHDLSHHGCSDLQFITTSKFFHFFLCSLQTLLLEDRRVLLEISFFFRFRRVVLARRPEISDFIVQEQLVAATRDTTLNSIRQRA